MKLKKQIVVLAALCAITGMASPGNSLMNGNFEAGTNGWTTWTWDAGWANITTNILRDGIEVSPTNGGNGTSLLNCGIGWNNGNGGGGGAYQIVPVTVGIGYWLTVQSGAADWWLPRGQMALIWLSDSTGTNAISTNAMFTVDPAVYGQNYDIPHQQGTYSMTKTAPAGATHVKVEFSSAMPPGTGGSVTFDNAVLIPLVYDSDGDGLPGEWELHYGLDPDDATGVNGADGDPDADGLSNIDEWGNVTNPQNPDTDADGLSDGDEVHTWFTNPNATDTDLDGFSDGYEVNLGYDPALASSTPDALMSIHAAVETPSDAVEVHFNAATGTVYRIEGTDSLSNAWSTIESEIPGNGGIIQRLYSTLDQSNRFFRAAHE